ncbi:hypothetical protein [Brevibacterium ravenspurgense]|uniref:hypothetical protein n=1 Tax=Brevibacterium ravenspurgense TaxID=479117 RepID=UPI000782BB0F|nr:hypothetical protein [Brevibacterium ravenspurgense]
MKSRFKRPATVVALCCFAATGLLFTVSVPAASTALPTSDTPYETTDPDGNNRPSPSDEPSDDSVHASPTDEPSEEPSQGSTTQPTAEPTDGPPDEPSDEPTSTPTGQPTEKPKPTSKPTQKPTEKPDPEQPNDPKGPPEDNPRLPNTGPPGSSPLPPDGRFNSDSSGRQGGYPDTGNGGTNWVPQSPSPGSGGYAEQNRGAVNDPVPTPEAEQTESSEDGSRNSALKGSQAGVDNAEARSSSLLWGGLTILVGLAIIVAAWLFLRRSQKDQKQRG